MNHRRRAHRRVRRSASPAEPGWSVNTPVSRSEPRSARAVDVKVSRQALTVDLADGRTLVVPITWFPRLLHGTPSERSHWRLIGGGEGVHWPNLDEDVSVEGLLAGLPSRESQPSLKRWLARRDERHDMLCRGRPARKRPGTALGHLDTPPAGRRPGNAGDRQSVTRYEKGRLSGARAARLPAIERAHVRRRVPLDRPPLQARDRGSRGIGSRALGGRRPHAAGTRLPCGHQR
jgi:hypothetical protein